MSSIELRVLVGRVTATVIVTAALVIPAAQERPLAEANQLHAAIANGDVEALKYWLDVRHADPNAPDASEPGVTPLGRCLALAGRVLDGRADPNASANTPAVSLRVLQDMLRVLDAHGATLSDVVRARSSAPVLRWYEDAIGHPPAEKSPSTPASAAAPAAPPPPPATPPTTPAPAPVAPQAASPVIDIARQDTLVVVSPDQKRSCNGDGHIVFLVNNALMPITARVVTHTSKQGEAKPLTRTDTFALEPGAAWELGCDALPGRGRVKYELKDWKY